MNSGKEERLTVLVRSIAEELMRKECRPVSVSEIQCYMSKMNGELSRKVSGKSVDYVRAVLGTSRVGRFRKFRCPSWVGLGAGESPRKLYWGECGVRYDEEWERESESEVDLMESGEGRRTRKGEGKGMMKVARVGVEGSEERWNGVGVGASGGGVGVGAGAGVGVGVGVGEVYGGVLGCVESVECGWNVWGVGEGNSGGEAWGRGEERGMGGECVGEGWGVGEGWWEWERKEEAEVWGVRDGGVCVWGGGRGLGRGRGKGNGNGSKSASGEGYREQEEQEEEMERGNGCGWGGESYESVWEEWGRVGSDWDVLGGESVCYEWW